MGAQIKQMAAGYDLMWVVEEEGKLTSCLAMPSLYKFVPVVGPLSWLNPCKNFHDLQQVIRFLFPKLPHFIPLPQSCSQDFEQNLTRELDFTLEASNGEETARQLKHRAPHVYVPKVFKDGQLQKMLPSLKVPNLPSLMVKLRERLRKERKQ